MSLDRGEAGDQQVWRFEASSSSTRCCHGGDQTRILNGLPQQEANPRATFAQNVWENSWTSQYEKAPLPTKYPCATAQPCVKKQYLHTPESRQRHNRYFKQNSVVTNSRAISSRVEPTDLQMKSSLSQQNSVFFGSAMAKTEPEHFQLRNANYPGEQDESNVSHPSQRSDRNDQRLYANIPRHPPSSFTDGGSSLPHSADTKPKQKRYRATHAQLNELLALFHVNPSPSSSQMAALSAKINMPVQSIALWFKNRRARTPHKLSAKRIKHTNFEPSQQSNSGASTEYQMFLNSTSDRTPYHSLQNERFAATPNEGCDEMSCCEPNSSTISQGIVPVSHSQVSSISGEIHNKKAFHEHRSKEPAAPLSPTAQKTYDAAKTLISFSEISREGCH